MLLPNNFQKTRLFQYSGVSRFAYNWALEKEMESLKNGKGFISDKDLRKEFTLLKKQKGYSWLNNVSNDVPKQAIKDLVSAYLKYFKLRKQKGYKPYSKKQIAHAKRIGKTLTEYDKKYHPKFKSKKDKQDYSFYNDTEKLEVKERAVRITSLYKCSNRKRQAKKSFIKLAERNRIPIDSKYKNPRITYDGIHWWISVVIDLERTNLKLSTTKSKGVGVDMGIKDLAIVSDKTKYANINKTEVVRKLEKRKRR
jgi:putative transposase